MWKEFLREKERYQVGRNWEEYIVECLEPSLPLRRVSFCKVDGGRELLTALWIVVFCNVLWGSEYSSIKIMNLNIVPCYEIVRYFDNYLKAKN